MKRGWRSANLSPDRRVFFGQGRGDVRSRALAARVTASFGSRSGSSTADLLFPLIFSPTILSITPSSGPLSGGTTVDIAGFNFITGATVTFDGIPATAVVVTPSHIFCNTPAHAIGAVNVVVTNPDLQTATLINGYSYTALMAAVGASVAASSPDGLLWTSRAIPAGTYNALAWNGFVYAAVGNASVAATSPDGVTWTARTIPAGSYTCIAWNGTVFCALAGTSLGATSPDGITWTSIAVAPNSPMSGLSWNGTVFAAVGGSGASFHSTDGTTWIAGGSTGSKSSVASRTNGLMYAVGASGGRTSGDNGNSWINRAPNGIGATPNSCAANASIFALINNSGSTIQATSDGVSYPATSFPAGDKRAVCWNGSLFVTTGTNASAFTSPDALTWTQQGAFPGGAFIAISAPITLPHA